MAKDQSLPDLNWGKKIKKIKKNIKQFIDLIGLVIPKECDLSISNDTEPIEVFIYGKDPNRRVKFKFSAKGKISVKIFWQDKSQETIKHKDKTPEEVLEMAPKLKEHLETAAEKKLVTAD